MDREFTRKELYEIVWSRPMKIVAAEFGISDVALAKHCKRFHIPVPSRGYWARKHAGKPTVQIPLPMRFPGSSDQIGGSNDRSVLWGSDWPEKILALDVPPLPTFEEDLAAVEQRARKLVGKVRCSNSFEVVHPVVAKLLADDEERRRQFKKWHSDYYAPKYDGGINRRRLLIINALFIAATNLGCSISTSKSRMEYEKEISIKIGQEYIRFTLEPIKSKETRQSAWLILALSNGSKSWEDEGRRLLEHRLADILVAMLVTAETLYRDSLLKNRQCIIENKTRAELELKRRAEEAERRAREHREKLARERVALLLHQAKAFDRANQIRAYVEAVVLRPAEIAIPEADINEWAKWARQQADSVDPVKNGSIKLSISATRLEG